MDYKSLATNKHSQKWLKKRRAFRSFKCCFENKGRKKLN